MPIKSVNVESTKPTKIFDGSNRRVCLTIQNLTSVNVYLLSKPDTKADGVEAQDAIVIYPIGSTMWYYQNPRVKEPRWLIALSGTRNCIVEIT